MSDFPDWQAGAATQGGNEFTSFSQTLTPGDHPGTVTPVYSWSSANIVVVPSAGAGKVTITHYADSAGANTIGTDTWDVNATTGLTVRVPLRGPYAQLSINVTSSGNMTAETWAVYQTYPADRISYPIAGQLIFDPDNTLAPSATQTYTLPWVVAGRASLSWVPFDSSAQLDIWIQAVDEAGTVRCRVTDLGNPTAVTNVLIECPDAILQAVVSNGDSGSSHSYGFCFTVPPQ